MRVLEWIFQRAAGRKGAVESPLGLMPSYADLTWKGLNFTEEQFIDLMAVDKVQGLNEALAQVNYFKQFKRTVPPEFVNEVSLLSLRLVRSAEVWKLPLSAPFKPVVQTAVKKKATSKPQKAPVRKK